MIQQAFIDMENMYDLLNETQEVSCVCSFIPDISIAPLQVHCYPEALPTTALILC